MTPNPFRQRFAPPPDPTDIMRAAGMEPDDWQRQLLTKRPARALLRCCRQSGKSTVAAAIALDQALTHPRSLTVIVAPAQRQASELHSKVRDLLSCMVEQPRLIAESALSLKLANRSRIITVPASERTSRGYSPSLLIVDEAGWVPDSLYHALTPSLSATKGRLLALSTPRGPVGWWYWYDAWQSSEDWHRIMVTAYDCGRIGTEELERQRRSMPALKFNAEYLCEWAAAEGAVFEPADIIALTDREVAPL